MELDPLLAAINGRYPTEVTETALRGITLKVLQIKDMAAYIEDVVERAPAGSPVRLPYWAKVWEASLVLADYLLSLPRFAPGAKPQRVIELGAGIGVPGLFLAAAGHSVTLTDLEPEALEFARACALVNGLGERVSVRPLDWLAPDIDDEFDAVIGSELLYHEADYPHLVRLLARLRREGVPAYLAKGPAIPSQFYDRRLRRDFEIEEVRRRLRAGGQAYPVSIFVLGRARAAAEAAA